VADKPLTPVQVTSAECDGSFEKMLRRFIRRSRDEGTADELKSRRAFMKPSQKRRMAKKFVKQ